MKRALILIFALCLVPSLAACGSDKKTPPPAEKKVDAKKPDAKKTEAKKADAKKAVDADTVKAGPDGKGGQVVVSEIYKIHFTVPEKWKVDKSETGISVSSPDQKAMIVVAGSKSQDLAEAALNDLKKNLEFKDVKFEKQGTTALNGLVGLRGEGDAVVVTTVEEAAKPADGKEAPKDAKADEAKDEKAVANKKEEAIHFVGFSTKVDSKAITVLLFTPKENYEKEGEKLEAILATFNKL